MDGIGLLLFKGVAALTVQELALHGISKKWQRCITTRNHELLIFDGRALADAPLLDLRTVEDVFFVPFVGLPIRQRKDLKKIRRYWNINHFHAGLAMKNRLGSPSSRSKTFAVFVKADFDRQVRRKEIAHELAQVPSTFSRWRSADPASLEVWGFYAQEQLTAGIRMTTNAFRTRPKLDRHRRAALRPTLAAAVCVASHPNATDTVLDPMCGTGTILYERAHLISFDRIFGADQDRDAVTTATANMQATFPNRAPIEVADARNLAIEDETIDVILCNLPFGKAFSNRRDNRKLYSELVPGFVRWLKPGGKIVCLTADQASWSRTFGACRDLNVKSIAKINVLGIWASIFRGIKRTWTTGR